MTKETIALLKEWAETYNNPEYFREDPIAFPTRFTEMMKAGKCSLKDVEIAAVFAAHFAWGRTRQRTTVRRNGLETIRLRNERRMA